MVTVGGASIVAAYVVSRPELLYVGALAVLLPMLAVAFARFRRLGLEVSREFSPDIIAVGGSVRVALTVVNTAPLATPELEWRDAGPWTGSPSTMRLLPPLAARRGRAIAPANRTVVVHELRVPRRGVFPIGPLGVVLADPFGLAVGEVRLGETDLLVVTPAIRELPDTGLAILASDGASKLVRRAIGGDDDLSTREYRTGDAMRRVHWRATARHGELMVRQEEPRSHAEARIILDTRRGGYASDRVFRHRDSPENDSFEVALALAGSIALHLSRGGFAVEFIETGVAQLSPVVPVGPFLRSLATAEPTVDFGAFGPGSPLHAASSRNRAHGSVFAVVGEADDETLERLIAQRSGFDLAVVFIIHASTSREARTLSEAGWTCVPVVPGDTIEGAWRAVALGRGARNVR